MSNPSSWIRDITWFHIKIKTKKSNYRLHGSCMLAAQTPIHNPEVEGTVNRVECRHRALPQLITVNIIASYKLQGKDDHPIEKIQEYSWSSVRVILYVNSNQTHDHRHCEFEILITFLCASYTIALSQLPLWESWASMIGQAKESEQKLTDGTYNTTVQ